MMQLSINRRPLWYAQKLTSSPIYARDDNGNVIYDSVDGERVPRVTGQTKGAYSNAVPFQANIRYGTGKVEALPFGLSDGSFDAYISAEADSLPINEKTLIWATGEPETVDASTADFVVSRVVPSLNEVVYLLTKVDHNGV